MENLPKSAREAKALGLTQYFTGEPCIRGHTSERQASDGKCVECRRATRRLHWHANRERLIQERKDWMDADPSRRKLAAERAKEWREANADAHKEYFRNLYQNNKELWKARQEVRKTDPAYQAKERERLRRKKEKNPDLFQQYTRNRRAKSRGAEGTHTHEEILAILEWQEYKCVTCGKDMGCNYHVDHIVPLSRGGSNWAVNLQGLCPSCNLKKHNKMPWEFTP